MDQATASGWPVQWTSDYDSLFLSGGEGLTPSCHSIHDVGLCTVWTCAREEGIQWCAPHWNTLYHCGAVPTSTEIRLHFDSSQRHAEEIDFKYDPWLDHTLSGDPVLMMVGDLDLIHGPDYAEQSLTLPAMPVVRAGTVYVPRWLMDTGSGLDIVTRARLAGCELYVSRNDDITLMTANGELDANEEICLYVASITSDITLTVLDDSPDVQSLGKRCIEDGFGFHWEPHSLTPYLVEPGTGRHIRLIVENFCPYLVDPIGAVPTLTHKNIVMATLTPTSSDPAKVALGAAVEIPAAVDMAELRLDADAQLPPADPPPAPHVDADPDGRRDLKAEAKSTAHILRHMPFNKYCETCVRAKMLRRPARRAVHKSENVPKKFGDLVNADHIIANSDEAMGLTGERNALAIVDRFSDYKDCFPLTTKDADEAHGALLEFFGRLRPKYMWTDSAPELIRAISNIKIPP